MSPRWTGESLGSELQTTALPFCFSRECFLLATNVSASRIDLGIASLLEAVENAVVGIEGRYAGAC